MGWYLRQKPTSAIETLYENAGIYVDSMTICNSPPHPCHFTDEIFKYIFMNEKSSILIKISLKFIPKGPIENNSALI